MIYIAPVQGHTDAAWRHFHHAVYGGDNRYFTPFMRCEHGETRRQDMRDYLSPLNDGIDLEPQVIFRDMAELDVLLGRLEAEGARAVNLNMGCPFPLQTGKGRGAGFIRNAAEASRLPETLAAHPGPAYSVKMRLGFESPDEWRGVIDMLNSLELTNIYLHPRVARQQYGGELHLDEFAAFVEASRNPVVFNGDIRTPGDIAEAERRFPGITGVMTARGVLGRPSLAAESVDAEEWAREKRIVKMMEFHRALLGHYEETLCGDAQVLAKIKPFWEYAEDEIGRKAWKAIRKASNMARYHSAVAMVE